MPHWDPDRDQPESRVLSAAIKVVKKSSRELANTSKVMPGGSLAAQAAALCLVTPLAVVEGPGWVYVAVEGVCFFQRLEGFPR